MDGMKPMCDHCPIEKNVNGACYDENGVWTLNNLGKWVFNGSWKCIYYDKFTNCCTCEKG